MRLDVRIIYTRHEARGPLHVRGTKMTMTVLDMDEFIGRFQKVRQTDLNSIGQEVPSTGLK